MQLLEAAQQIEQGFGLAVQVVGQALEAGQLLLQASDGAPLGGRWKGLIHRTLIQVVASERKPPGWSVSHR